jgi:hypothetical protein
MTSNFAASPSSEAVARIAEGFVGKPLILETTVAGDGPSRTYVESGRGNRLVHAAGTVAAYSALVVSDACILLPTPHLATGKPRLLDQGNNTWLLPDPDADLRSVGPDMLEWRDPGAHPGSWRRLSVWGEPDLHSLQRATPAHAVIAYANRA